ncbi:MAG: 3',5'-cyclic adenosine monophosphate phosphodiesterase CpdA [Rhizobiaceae bacterium MnEN-MB40S]|nr:MAG: 3',5'-cyclic adenosine monophosphate phosphodiesterase CpdA [Rhizobiaceae bacterium MnEN-MB40S]
MVKGNKSKFIHLTDVHVVGEGKTMYGSDPAKRLAGAVESINAEHADAEFAVIGGDLTHWGGTEEYEAVKKAVSGLKIPLILMVGNHDAVPELRRHFSDAFDDGNGFVQGVWRTDAGKCLFLQTLQEGVHSGHYCEKRQAWLKAQLDADDNPVFLFMHHPPFEVGIVGMDGSRMLDSEALWSILEPHRARIRHLFFGHIHRPIFGSWRGVPVSCMRSTNQQLALDLRDETENPDIRRVPGNMEEPAYGVVLADRDTVIVHMHEYRRRTPEFLFIPPADQREGRGYAHDMKLEGFEG